MTTTTAIELEDQLILAREDIEYGKDRVHYLQGHVEELMTELLYVRERISRALEELPAIDQNRAARRILRHARIRSGVRFELTEPT